MNTNTERFHRACVQAVMMLVQHMSVDPDWLSPPEDGDWLRSSLEDAANWAEKSGDTERAAKIRKALWQPVMYSNTYHCDACNVAWDDEHSCACDDECPRCGDCVSPESSERINP